MTIESPQSHLTGNISMTYASFLFLRGYQAVTKENSSRNKKGPGHPPTMAGCIVKGKDTIVRSRPSQTSPLNSRLHYAKVWSSALPIIEMIFSNLTFRDEAGPRQEVHRSPSNR